MGKRREGATNTVEIHLEKAERIRRRRRQSDRKLASRIMAKLWLQLEPQSLYTTLVYDYANDALSRSYSLSVLPFDDLTLPEFSSFAVHIQSSLWWRKAWTLDIFNLVISRDSFVDRAGNGYRNGYAETKAFGTNTREWTTSKQRMLSVVNKIV